MKICIVTGGSGGHIFPALTFAKEAAKKHDVFFIGNDHKMESWLVPNAGFAFKSIHNNGIQGSVFDKVKAVLGQFSAIAEAKKILRQEKPDCVFSFGGYVGVPVTLAAKALKIPIILHEQNAFPGKANKLVAKDALAVITSYQEAFEGQDHVHFLGNPQASVITSFEKSPQALIDLGLKEDLPLVLFVMGSQGSQSMNQKFLGYLEDVKDIDYQVLMVVGPTNYDEFMTLVPNLPQHIVVAPFINQQAILPYVDLIVCRSGASTIAEIESYGIASLFIPSPHVANNHQYYNALSLYKEGACDLLEEKDITEHVLFEKISGLLNDEKLLSSFRSKVHDRAKINAVYDILSCVESVVPYE